MNQEHTHRQDPDTRLQSILDAAVALAAKEGYRVISRGQIAEAAGCAASLISHYLGDMPAIRQAIMEEAIRVENIEIILQGIVVQDGLAKRAPKRLRVAAQNLLNADV